MPPLAPTPLGTRLSLRFQPRASSNAIVGLHGQCIRVRLTAPPVDGAANSALLDFLASRLGVAPATLELVRGHSGREKVVEVTGLTPEEVARRLGL